MNGRTRQGLKALTLVAVVAVGLAILVGFDPGSGARNLPEAMAASTAAATPTQEPGATPAAGDIDSAADGDDGGPSSFEELQQLLEADPTNADLWRDLGANLVTSHEYVSAAEAFAAAVELRPNDARLHSDLATALLYQGLVRVARAEYERALEIDPRLPEAHFNLGITYSHSAPLDLERALASWRRAVEYSVDPDLTALAQQYILAYEQAGPTSGAADGEGEREIEAGTGDPAAPSSGGQGDDESE